MMQGYVVLKLMAGETRASVVHWVIRRSEGGGGVWVSACGKQRGSEYMAAGDPGRYLPTTESRIASMAILRTYSR